MGLLKQSAAVVLIATAIAADASAWGPPAAVRSNVESEIAWARATWPDVFKGVRFQMPLATLLAWVPRRGSIPAYLYREPDDGSRGRCEEVELGRPRREDDDGDVPGSQVLIATIAGPTRVEAGRTVRNVAYVYAGVEMSQDRLTFPVQARDARGHWKAAGGITVGEIPASFGWLSYADDRVARWDATPLTLRIECPMEWLACPVTGGGRSCQQCERVSPYLLEFGTEILRSYLDRSLPAATCDDPCPPPDSPDIARLRRLDQRVDLWRPRRTPLARVSSLYRSLDDCLRDHPPRAAGAGKK